MEHFLINYNKNSLRMRRVGLILLAIAFTQTVAIGQQLRRIKNEAFARGEKLVYKAYYDSFLTGKVTAGEAVFEIQKEDKKIANRSTYHIELIGRTKGAFNWFNKVYDRYETFIDEKAIIPWVFIRRVREGNYIANQDVTFNHFKKVAYFKDNKNGTSVNIAVPDYTQDIVSAIYFARTFDFASAKENDEFSITFMLDDSVYTTKIIYIGKETLKTEVGRVNCLKLRPEVLTGSVFAQQYPLTLWISDDKNLVPILAESEILIGSVKIELIKYKGLANPFKSLIK